MRGDLGEAWSYDAFYMFGRVNYNNVFENDFSVTRLVRATDVVTGPNGQPVCRSVVDGTDATCVPYDIFAPNSVTPAALNYLQIPLLADGLTEETVAGASITGNLGVYGIQ